MEAKKPPSKGNFEIPSEEVPPISPDREHLLARKFEDANVDEIFQASQKESPPSGGIVQEAVEAVQELVGEASEEFTLDLSGISNDPSMSIESASASGGSMIPESQFQDSSDSIDVQMDVGNLELQLSERPSGAGSPTKIQAPEAHAAPGIAPTVKPAATPTATSAATPVAAPLAAPRELPKIPDQPFQAEENMEMVQGPDSQSFMAETSNALLAQEEMAPAESSEGNLFMVGATNVESAHYEALTNMTDQLFQLVVCELTFDELTEALLTSIVGAAKAQAGSILEFDFEKLEFFFRSSLGGGDPAQLKNFRVPAHHGIAGLVAEKKEILLLSDLDQDKQHLRAVSLSVGFEANSCIAAPILIGHQLYGVLEIFNKEGGGIFTEDDLKLVEAWQRSIAKILEVRFLMAELVRKAG